MRFKGKVVIVTGGSKGIGEGCARVFCREGGLVSILARGPGAGKKLAEEWDEIAIICCCTLYRLPQPHL